MALGRRIFFWLASVVALIALLGVGIGAGVLIDKAGILPNWLVEKIDQRARSALGMPTQQELELARIETTFIRFSGKEYVLPNSDWINGGALATWGDDLILVVRDGTIYRFVEGEGLVKTEVRPPQNGLEAYVRVAQSERYANYRHRPNTLRFNDIRFVELPAFRGLILSYTFFDEARECYGSRMARLPVAGEVTSITALTAQPEDWTVFFESTPCLPLNPTWTALDGMMAGGRFDLTADGQIILGVGDYHLDGIHTYDAGIQSTETSYGKVLQVDPITGASSIIAMGHRNLQGVVVTDKGEIWTVEHGVRGGDELNFVKKGENHGWPLESYGTLYSGQPLPVPGVQGQHDRFDKPAFAWLPSAGVSALTQITDFHPAWDGDLLAGSLSSKEFGQSLWHIRTDGEHIVFAEQIRLGRRVRSVVQWGDKIAIWSDPTSLIILQQEARPDPLADAIATMVTDAGPDMATRVHSVLEGCRQCHSFEQFQNAGAPSLNGVVGRKVAGTDFDGYSDTLRGLGGVWTTERLTAFLDNPQSLGDGVAMPDPELDTGPLLDAVIETLSRINTVDDKHLTYN